MIVADARSRPALMSPGMVRRILKEKTQTRRPVKAKAWPMVRDCRLAKLDGDVAWFELPRSPYEECWFSIRSTWGGPRGRLWVRENAYITPPGWASPEECNCTDDEGRPRHVGYAADMGADAVRCARDYGLRCTPSILVPRWACRLELEVLDLRVERVTAISSADCIAEGLSPTMRNEEPARPRYRRLWESLYGPGSWLLDDWVWAYTFRIAEIRGPLRKVS